MHKLQKLLHLIFCDCLSCDCVIYQYSGKLKSEWILYQNVIIHRHLKGWAQHSPDGMNGTVAFPILLLQFDKEQLCIGCFHTSYCLLPNASFASNLCTVTYPCFVLCLTPVFVFKYRSTSSQTVICPSTIFTSKSKSVFTCFSNYRRERHGFLPFGSLSVGSNFQLYTKCGFPSI